MCQKHQIDQAYYETLICHAEFKSTFEGRLLEVTFLFVYVPLKQMCAILFMSLDMIAQVHQFQIIFKTSTISHFVNSAICLLEHEDNTKKSIAPPSSAVPARHLLVLTVKITIFPRNRKKKM